MDDTVSRIDMVSKILNALYRLEITWSDIETDRQHNFNWRLSNSLWGKLSKSIYGSNRAGYRAKIMNVWRSNQSKIRQNLQRNSASLEQSDSVLTLPISINLHKYSLFLPSLNKSSIRICQNPKSYDLASVDTEIVDSNDALLSYSQGFDRLPNSSYCPKPVCSHANSVPVNLGDPQNAYNADSMTSFEFLLNRDEWDLISPRNNRNKLNKEWTNIFSKKLSGMYPYCVIRCNYHRVNKGTVTQSSPYIVAEAKCLFQDCLRFKFFILNSIQSDTDVIVKVDLVGSVSNQHFDNTSSCSRKLSGLHRKVVGEKLVHNSTSNYHYEQFTASTSLEVAKHGNLNLLKSQDVLRKVKSEYESRCRMSDDMWQDIIITQKTYESNIQGTFLNGYIQTVSRYPIVIHMYTEEQILLIKNLQQNNLILHLDATGSVVRKIDKLHKRILYYALVVRHPEAQTSPVPLAEMLSSEHTNVEITHFLTKWLYNMKKILNKETILTQVEVDFSWPMLHSVCNSFNTQTLDNYLQICWERISPNGICMYPLKTMLHICSAHIMNRFSYKIERNLIERPNKETKRFIMFIMVRLTSCTTLDEMDQLFTSLCILCLSRVKYLEIEQYSEKLQNAVYNFDENYEFEMEYLSEIDEELPNEMGDSITYRKKSPFGKHFDTILKKCNSFVQNLECKHEITLFGENNKYYLPSLPGFLATHYMPISPLWTGLIIGPALLPGKFNVTFTNSIAENWMRIIKKNILKDEIKLRPGDFIRRTYQGVSGRVKAFDFAFNPISRKVLKKTKKKIDDTQIEEVWERRKTKRSYFKPCKISKTKDFSILKCKHTKNPQPHKTIKKIGRNFSTISSDNRNVNSQKKATHDFELSSDDSILSISEEVHLHYQGQFTPVGSRWQRQKCKEFLFTFVCGVIYENEASDKTLEIRKLAPSKEKRISPDGNCLFRSLSYCITGSDNSHEEIRDLLIQSMTNKYRKVCTSYCTAHYNLLPEHHCTTIEDYIKVSLMDRVGSWGTDLELFLAAQLLKTDIFVYTDGDHVWNRFSANGFNDKRDIHDLTEERVYLRLYFNHFQPVLKVNKVEEVLNNEYVEDI